MRRRDDLYSDARNADADTTLSKPPVTPMAAKPPTLASPLTSMSAASASPSGNIFLHSTTAITTSPSKRNAALNSLLNDDDDDEDAFVTPPESDSELMRGPTLESSSSLQDVSAIMETASIRESINSKAVAGPKGTALAIEEAIYGDGKGDEDAVDYRMDFEDFVKVQQIDDVLVAALLKKPRSAEF